jgi:hypothetical protein
MMKTSTHAIRRSCFALALLSSVAVMAAPAPGKGHDNDKAKVKDWFLQTLLVVDNGSELVGDTRSGVIGRLDSADEGPDLHDIPVFANVNGSRGAVVITHGAQWGDKAGQYLSDYRSSGADKQVWDLAVTSCLDNASVTLYWEGLYQITPRADGGYDWQLNNASSTLKSLRLVDLETGEVIPAIGKKGELNSYTFDMNGAGERLFRWVQGNVGKAELGVGSATSLRAFGPLETESQARALSVSPAQGGLPPPPSLDAPAQPAPPSFSKEREK